MQFSDTAVTCPLSCAPSVCVILREHRFAARTFTVKLCPDVSGLSCDIVVNTGWRFAGVSAIFFAERPRRPKFVSGWATIPSGEIFSAPVPLYGDLGPADTYTLCAKRGTDLKSDSGYNAIF